jgi:hypothetical protein
MVDHRDGSDPPQSTFYIIRIIQDDVKKLAIGWKY